MADYIKFVLLSRFVLSELLSLFWNISLFNLPFDTDY